MIRQKQSAAKKEIDGWLGKKGVANKSSNIRIEWIYFQSISTLINSKDHIYIYIYSSNKDYFVGEEKIVVYHWM